MNNMLPFGNIQGPNMPLPYTQVPDQSLYPNFNYNNAYQPQNIEERLNNIEKRLTKLEQKINSNMDYQSNMHMI